MRSITSLAVAALVLAGCASGPSSPLDVSGLGAEPDDAGPAMGPAAAGDVAWARFAWTGRLDKVLWSNGTLKATQASRVVDGAPRLPATVEPSDTAFDITRDLPVGVPVIIDITVDAKVGRGDVDVWLEAPDDDFRTADAQSPYGGASRVILTIVHAGNGAVRVHLYYDVAGEAPDAPYSMSVHLRHMPPHVPGGVATALELTQPENALIVALMGKKRSAPWYEPERASLMVWGPRDEYLGAYTLADEGNTTIPLPPETGTFVVLLSQGGREAMLATTAPVTLAALKTAWVEGEEMRGADARSVEWSTTYPRVPMLVGAIVSPSVASQDIEARITGPAGVVLEVKRAGGPWLSASLPTGHGIQTAFWFDSGVGAEGLVAGAYHSKVAFGQAAGSDPATARSVAAFYVR